MTREEAIDIFEDNFTVLNTHGHYTEDEEAEAITMAMKALEQESCEDCISRILEQIDKSYAYFEGDVRYGFDICKDIIDKELKKMPSIQPKTKVGR